MKDRDSPQFSLKELFIFITLLAMSWTLLPLLFGNLGRIVRLVLPFHLTAYFASRAIRQPRQLAVVLLALHTVIVATFMLLAWTADDPVGAWELILPAIFMDLPLLPLYALVNPVAACGLSLVAGGAFWAIAGWYIAGRPRPNDNRDHAGRTGRCLFRHTILVMGITTIVCLGLTLNGGTDESLILAFCVGLYLLWNGCRTPAQLAIGYFVLHSIAAAVFMLCFQGYHPTRFVPLFKPDVFLLPLYAKLKEARDWGDLFLFLLFSGSVGWGFIGWALGFLRQWASPAVAKGEAPGVALPAEARAAGNAAANGGRHG